MKALFVASSHIGSRIIRWGLGEDCSHFAVCFDEDEHGGGIIFHSYGKGPQLCWMRDFLEKYTVVHALVPLVAPTLENEEAIYKGMISAHSKDKYDYFALAWWSWRAALKKFMGVAIPPRNEWQRGNMSLCTALASGWPQVADYAKSHSIDLEMITPHELMLLMRRHIGFEEAPVAWLEKVNSHE